MGYYLTSYLLLPQITSPVGYLQCDTSDRDALLKRTARTSFCLCLTLVRLGPLGLLILTP